MNLVEIDLLRGGEHATAVPLEQALAVCGTFDYHVSVHPFDDFETFYVYPMHLQEPLATIDVPLLPGDPAVLLDLQAVFDRCYDAGPYAREIDYVSIASHTCTRAPSQAAWVEEIVGRRCMNSAVLTARKIRLEIARTRLPFPVTMWGDGSFMFFGFSHVPDECRSSRSPK